MIYMQLDPDKIQAATKASLDLLENLKDHSRSTRTAVRHSENTNARAAREIAADGRGYFHFTR